MTTKTEVLQAIRAKCLDCCAGQPSEIRLCFLTSCSVHPFRMGTDPNPARGGKRPAFTRSDPVDDGQPDEQQEWQDYDPDC